MSFPYTTAALGEGPSENPLIIVVQMKEWVGDLYQRMLSYEVPPEVLEGFIIDFCSNVPVTVSSYKKEVEEYIKGMGYIGLDGEVILPYMQKLIGLVVSYVTKTKGYRNVTYFEIELIRVDKRTCIFTLWNVHGENREVLI